MSEAALALEDGSVYVGEPFGASVDVAAEVVFNTGMTGYQEVTTDPSYRGQMVVMTHPQIGNYGVAASGDESVRPWVSALIVRELATHPHHWEARMRLEEFLAKWGVPGLQGIDTRSLVRRLRETGTQRGVLRHSASPAGFTPDELEEVRAAARRAPSVSQLDLVTGVSAVLPVAGAEGEIAVLDCGAKWNILRSLERRGVRPRVWPWNASAAEILASRPRGVLISNGPGDPAKLPSVVRELGTLVQSGTPVMGICLGHQLLGLVAGATTNRLPYGHHGGNHPVRDLATGRVTITTQNHEFQVVAETISAASGFEVSHINLNDGSVEGLRHRELPVFSVQYHPEGCPGPQDSQPLFDDFLHLCGMPLGSGSTSPPDPLSFQERGRAFTQNREKQFQQSEGDSEESERDLQQRERDLRQSQRDDLRERGRAFGDETGTVSLSSADSLCSPDSLSSWENTPPPLGDRGEGGGGWRDESARRGEP